MSAYLVDWSALDDTVHVCAHGVTRLDLGGHADCAASEGQLYVDAVQQVQARTGHRAVVINGLTEVTR